MGIISCKICSKEFLVSEYLIKQGRKFCSLKCRNTSYVLSIDECILKYTPILSSEVCWEWLGLKRPNGYGYFTANKVLYSAHREVYKLKKGDIPNGLIVLHTCDNPPCVNPEHLILGTSKDNSEDMVRKGRSNKGEDRYNSKLTNIDVLEIRSIYRNVKYGKRTKMRHILAEEFNVSPVTIKFVVENRNWKDVQENV